MKKQLLFSITFIVLLFGVGPWAIAWMSSRSATYYYGLIGGHSMGAISVDGTHFDRFQTIVFDRTDESRLKVDGGKIQLDGNTVEFPEGKNVAVLQPGGTPEFAYVTAEDIIPGEGGDTKIYYLFGPLPKFTKFPFGEPKMSLVESWVKTWKATSAPARKA